MRSAYSCPHRGHFRPLPGGVRDLRWRNIPATVIASTSLNTRSPMVRPPAPTHGDGPLYMVSALPIFRAGPAALEKSWRTSGFCGPLAKFLRSTRFTLRDGSPRNGKEGKNLSRSGNVPVWISLRTQNIPRRCIRRRSRWREHVFPCSGHRLGGLDLGSTRQNSSLKETVPATAIW